MTAASKSYNKQNALIKISINNLYQSLFPQRKYLPIEKLLIIILVSSKTNSKFLGSCKLKTILKIFHDTRREVK